MKKYELTPEHRAQLEPWRDKWIANALSTKQMDDEDRAKTIDAVNGLYDAANLKRPKHIVFVPSPFVLAFAGGYSAAIWHLYKKRAATRAATGAATEAATEAATGAATETKNLKEWFVYPTGLQKNIARRLLGGNAEFGIRCAASAYNMWNGGNQWSGYVAYLSFFRHVSSLPIDYSKWDHYESAAIHSGPRIVHEDFCMISDRPEILLQDDQNRPHCDDGPFCRWRDGSALYAVHGTRVPAWIIEHPQDITVSDIDGERNAEIRRVMIDRYRTGEEISGAAAYLRDGEAELLDHDDQHGLLLRRNVSSDEPIVMVQVLNPTPEPDGPLSEDEAREIFGSNAVDAALVNYERTAMWLAGMTPRFKQYFLRVSPDLRPMKNGEFVGPAQKLTARNAVASTWGLTGDEFAPMQRG